VNRPYSGANEAGSATTELAIVMPALLLLIMLIVQFALWYHAQTVAVAAAQDGVRTARIQGATAADGEKSSRAFLAQAGGRLVEAPAVSANRGPDNVRVEVHATVVSVVPGLHLAIDEEAQAPLEQFRAESQR
jgi:Flp pilus assembly protein TadG